MNFIPTNESKRKEMLKETGIESIKELFKDVPEKAYIDGCLNLPKGLSERELVSEISKLAVENAHAGTSPCFLGAGAYNHFCPAVVPALIGRSEFYTAYTPYQAEASQGMLQAIYEFQTWACLLTGMDLANASMYDASTALAESMFMSKNLTGKNKAIVSKHVHPHYRQVLETYAWAHGMELIGTEEPEKEVDEKTACVIVQNPNFLGQIEKLKELGTVAHSKGALLVVCVGDSTSLGAIENPGQEGADIAVGDCQAFGIPLWFGGPHAGFMTTKKEHMRHIPGRLVGRTVDEEGKTGFILTLQAREQHIRRERAESNICTNAALTALWATVWLASLGEDGLKKLAEENMEAAKKASKELDLEFEENFYNEFVVKVNNKEDVKQKLADAGVIAPLDLEEFYPELKNHLLVCVTEMNSDKEIEMLKKVLK